MQKYLFYSNNSLKEKKFSMKYKNEILNLEKNGYAIFKSVIPKNF